MNKDNKDNQSDKFSPDNIFKELFGDLDEFLQPDKSDKKGITVFESDIYILPTHLTTQHKTNQTRGQKVLVDIIKSLANQVQSLSAELEQYKKEAKKREITISRLIEEILRLK